MCVFACVCCVSVMYICVYMCGGEMYVYMCVLYVYGGEVYMYMCVLCVYGEEVYVYKCVLCVCLGVCVWRRGVCVCKCVLCVYMYMGRGVCVHVCVVCMCVYGEVLLDAFSRPARKNTTDQNLLRQNFIAYIFGSQESKRPAPSPRSESPSIILGARAPARQSAERALLFTSLGSERAQGAQSQRDASEREWRKPPSPF